MKLSILVPFIRRHEAYFYKLQFNLNFQILQFPNQVEMLWDNHEYDTVGKKRNRLLERATGKYLCFFDADDTPSDDYVDLLMEGIEAGCDCASLRGEITIDGGGPEIFEHSLKYKEWRTTKNEIKYERYPNHLNMIRADIAKQFQFPETNFGEDHNWSKQIHESKLLKTEHYIPEVIYYYNYVSIK